MILIIGNVEFEYFDDCVFFFDMVNDQVDIIVSEQICDIFVGNFICIDVGDVFEFVDGGQQVFVVDFDEVYIGVLYFIKVKIDIYYLVY